MNTGHVRAAALAAAVTMMLAGCAAAQGGAGLAALTRPGDRNVTVAAIPSADLAGLYIAPPTPCSSSASLPGSTPPKSGRAP